MKLNPEVKTKWVEALRSGKYKKGIGQLMIEAKDSDSGEDEYCCLGVLADVLGLDIYPTDGKIDQIYADKFGLDGKVQVALADLNDQGKTVVRTGTVVPYYGIYEVGTGCILKAKTFKGIAGIIERRL